MSRALIVVCSAILLVTSVAFGAELAPRFDALEAEEPAEQYRQLSLMLLVSAGVDRDMLDAMGPALPVTEDGRLFQPEDYTTPLARIVDQSTMLAGAAQLFTFALENEREIKAQLSRLESGFSEAVAGVDMTVLSEDTIVIRRAIADSMAYGGLAEGEGSAAQRYRIHTVYLRNAMEYEQFQTELDRITDQAIASVGGKLDAYQRMFDDETNSGTFDRRIRSAELIYLPEGQFDPRAGELTEEMIRNMMMIESQPNR